MAKRGPRQPPNIEHVVKQYEAGKGLYVDFTRKLRVLLEDLLNSRKIRYQVVESRTKDVDSFREKITRATKHYSEPLKEITDLIGLRIIVYYLDDIDLVRRVLEEEFTVYADESVDKGSLLQPNEFGYRSIHYIASLSSSRDSLPEWKAYSSLKAEIQVRTVLQHAWAAISHALQYKREQDVPSMFKRRLSRLAGLFEISDEEFANLRRDQNAFAGEVSANMIKGNTALEINAISLEEYIRESFFLSLIVEDALKAGFKSTDEADTNSSTISALIDMCNAMSISNLDELERTLSASQSWRQHYFDELIEQNESDLWVGSAAFFALLIVIAVNIDKIDQTALVNKGWTLEVASNVITAGRRAQQEIRKTLK